MVFFNSNGAVAQLGERVTGSHKVRGSIPLSSTNDIKGLGSLTNPLILPRVSSGASLTLIFALNEGLNGGLFKHGIVCYAPSIRR
jgi:hypothetical protein